MEENSNKYFSQDAIKRLFSFEGRTKRRAIG